MKQVSRYFVQNEQDWCHTCGLVLPKTLVIAYPVNAQKSHFSDLPQGEKYITLCSSCISNFNTEIMNGI
jgi:hypothetical protein